MAITEKGYAVASTLRAYKNDANQAVGIGGNAVVHFTVVEFDRLGEFNTATWTFTAARTGYYLITTEAIIDLTVAAANAMPALDIEVNGAGRSRTLYYYTAILGNVNIQTTTLLYLVALDTVQVRFINAGGQAMTVIAGRGTNLCIKRFR